MAAGNRREAHPSAQWSDLVSFAQALEHAHAVANGGSWSAFLQIIVGQQRHTGNLSGWGAYACRGGLS
jgi:hypothetical protein